MPLRLYNTLTKQVEDFRPGDPAHVTFYSCGPTVYDDAHIGNFRSFLAADVLRRFIESPLCELANETAEQARHRREHGRKVTHVMNITDVGHMTDDAEGGEAGEDRMAVAGRRLLEAKKAGKLPADAKIDPSDPYAIAEFYANRFLEDARTLGLKVAVEAQKDATLMPRPTQKIAGMVRMIADLIAKGNAYAVGEPGRQVVYFDVQSYRGADGALLYGRLSGNTLDKLRTGAGGRISDANQAQKKHPADFLLWKADASHIMKWDPAGFDARAKWGAGYPGWHIECSVMAAERLGNVIDLHSGGEDNIFPHHECEIAQSRCAHGTSAFARLWFHGRHLMVNGDKMSKSKGNFYTIRDLIGRGVTPEAIRLSLIKTYYRSNANFTEHDCRNDGLWVLKWARCICWLTAYNEHVDAPRPNHHGGISELSASLRELFSRYMSADLNIVNAVVVLDDALFRAAESLPSAFRNSQPQSVLWFNAQDALARLPPRASAGPRAGPTEDIRDFLCTVRACLNVLGLVDVVSPKPTESTDIGIFLAGSTRPDGTPDPAIIARLEARRDAKARKDFKASDAIRDELAAMGLAIKDVAGGKVEVSRKA